MGGSKSFTRWLKKSLSFSKRGNLGNRKMLQLDESQYYQGYPQVVYIGSSFSDVSIGTYLTSPIELPPDSQVMPSSESFEDFRQLHGEMLDSEDYSTPGNDPWLPMQADFSPDPYFHPSASEIAFLTDPNIELDTTVYPENWLSPLVPQMDPWLPMQADFSPDPYFHPSASEIAFLTDPNIKLDTTVYPENWLAPLVPQMDPWLPTTCDFSILDEDIANMTCSTANSIDLPDDVFFSMLDMSVPEEESETICDLSTLDSGVPGCNKELDITSGQSDISSVLESETLKLPILPDSNNTYAMSVTLDIDGTDIAEENDISPEQAVPENTNSLVLASSNMDSEMLFPLMGTMASLLKFPSQWRKPMTVSVHLQSFLAEAVEMRSNLRASSIPFHLIHRFFITPVMREQSVAIIKSSQAPPTLAEAVTDPVFIPPVMGEPSRVIVRSNPSSPAHAEAINNPIFIPPVTGEPSMPTTAIVKSSELPPSHAVAVNDPFYVPGQQPLVPEPTLEKKV
jgi:hypothetical protein